MFKGKVAPAHPGTAVTIQVRRGTSWTRYAKVRTSATSTFLLRRRGLRPRAKYRFRAVLAADAEHLAGTSAEAYVDRMKVALTVTVKARRATFTGVVSPRHSRLPVTIKVLRAGRLVTFARTRLSRTSRFRLVKRLAPGAYVFQAVTGDDRDHFGGLSAKRSVVVR